MRFDSPTSVMQDRRRWLKRAASAAGALAVGGNFARAADCVLTSRQVEGPYYIAGTDTQADVRAGKPGVDLTLRFNIVDAEKCEPLAGAVTEIWSCDALGNYSGHPDVDPNSAPGGGAGGGRGRRAGGRPGGARRGGGGGRGGMGGHREPTGPERFLRGVQTTSESGDVEFLTIYPGWYAPRAVHVHVKIAVGGNQLLTTQLYFPDDLTATIHKTGLYAERFPSPYTNETDFVKLWMGGEPVGVYPEMSHDGDTHVGTLTLAVQRG